MIAQFSLRRVIYAIQRNVSILRGTINTGLALGGAILYLAFLISLRGDKRLTAEEFSAGFGFFYMVLGILFTFSIFKEAHNQKSNHLYFTLPISPLERIVSVWLTTTLLYTFIFFVMTTIIGQISIFTGAVIFRTDFHLVPAFSGNIASIIKGYFIIQPLFLLGSIAFKRNRLGKTILALAILFFAFMVFNLFLMGILNYEFDMFSGQGYGSEAYELAQRDFSGLGSWVYGMIFGPVMLVAAYLKLVEKEV